MRKNYTIKLDDRDLLELLDGLECRAKAYPVRGVIVVEPRPQRFPNSVRSGIIRAKRRGPRPEDVAPDGAGDLVGNISTKMPRLWRFRWRFNLERLRQPNLANGDVISLPITKPQKAGFL